MEPHGNNPLKNVIGIIPARYASSRLPGKMLLPIAGKPLILHTVERAAKANLVSRVIVATDDQRIIDAVTAAGHEAVMTSAEHASGSDRIAEVAQKLPKDSIIVNVQGDEPVISPKTIDLAVETMLASDEADIVTTWEPLSNKRDILDPNIVKVVTDHTGRALYFSRSPIPYLRGQSDRHGAPNSALKLDGEQLDIFKKHTGLYVYRREYLLKFTELAQTTLEKAEMLEQLRALENGAVILVVKAEESSIGVDTYEDLERVRGSIEAGHLASMS